MSAQQICDHIDSLFGDSSRSQEETLADMQRIADRAGMFAALGDDDDDYEYDDSDDWGDDDDIAA